jgi:hypothetical protein
MRSVRPLKKDGEKEKKRKNERKREREHTTILLPHLCFRVAPCISYREAP